MMPSENVGHVIHPVWWNLALSSYCIIPFVILSLFSYT